MECTRDAEEKRMRREFGQQNVAKDRLSVSRSFDKIKKKCKLPLIVSCMKW